MIAELPKKVASGYETTSRHNIVDYKNRKIDFRKLTVAEAKELAADPDFGLISKKPNVSRKKEYLADVSE